MCTQFVRNMSSSPKMKCIVFLGTVRENRLGLRVAKFMEEQLKSNNFDAELWGQLRFIIVLTFQTASSAMKCYFYVQNNLISICRPTWTQLWHVDKAGSFLRTGSQRSSSEFNWFGKENQRRWLLRGRFGWIQSQHSTWSVVTQMYFKTFWERLSSFFSLQLYPICSTTFRTAFSLTSQVELSVILQVL